MSTFILLKHKKMPSNLSIFFIIDLLLAIRFYQ